MGASASASVRASQMAESGGRPSNLATMYYVYWFDTAYPNGEYSGYQDMLPESIFGIPYKIGTKLTPAIRFLNTSYACTKYIVVVTGKKKKQLVREINGSPSVMKIYIIKPFAEKLAKWVSGFDKVQVFRDFKPLVKELVQLLNPLDPIKETVVDMKSAIEYIAHANPVTMMQQTVSALEDEKAQEDDQLMYKTVYSLTLQLILNKYNSKEIDWQKNALSVFLSQGDSGMSGDSRKNFGLYLKLLRLAIRLDQYPLIFAGLTIPQVRGLLAAQRESRRELLICMEAVDPAKPLKNIIPDVVKRLHSALIQIVAQQITAKSGTHWTKLYFSGMLLADMDFCMKLFFQQMLDCADEAFKEQIHSEFAVTLSQASLASDIRVSAFNDLVEKSKPPTPEERKLCLRDGEATLAAEACGMADVVVFDINSSTHTNLFVPLVPQLARTKKCHTYKLVHDFATDFEAQAELRHKILYAVIPAGLPRLEFERMLDVFVAQSITPILIIYLPKAMEREVSKAMFRNKWIITTVYAETFGDIVDYVNDSEVNISKEMMYFSKTYSNFSKTMASYNNGAAAPERQLSPGDGVEQDAAFEVLTEINSGIFSQLVEELSLGTKLIGSLHYYMWTMYKAQHQETIYWKDYAPLFGITPKSMNILDVNFGKNVLRAYTLQSPPPFYKILNDAFRSGDPEKIAKFRGFFVILHDLIKKAILKHHTGTVYRGTYFNPSVLDTLKPGLRVFSTCFTSTSKSLSVAQAFARKTKRNVLLEIELHPRGCSNVDIHSEGVSRYPEEQEVLLLPFTSLEIHSMTQEENWTTISLKEVLPEVEVVNLKGIDYSN